MFSIVCFYFEQKMWILIIAHCFLLKKNQLYNFTQFILTESSGMDDEISSRHFHSCLQRSLLQNSSIIRINCLPQKCMAEMSILFRYNKR